MAKDDRSAINPFTNKKHLDLIDDDKFLDQCYAEYNEQITNFKLLDDTEQGKLVRKIANDLINALENFLIKIGRYDYVEDYYDWEFHLVANHAVNAWCMPGGKIVMYSGMLGPANTEDDIALVLGHEMAHALLDHSRTQVSARNAKNAITTAAWVGSLGLSLFGMGELGALTRTVTNVADIGSEYLLLKPFGREHEFEADKLGMMIMHWAGYDISGAPEFWSRVSANNKNEMDFFSTHPADSKRIENMKQLILEIEGGKDFYSAPVLGDGTVTTNTQTLLENQIKCPSCGKILADDMVFCTECGTKIIKESSKKLCPKCHKSVDEDSMFCIHCGEKLSEDEDNEIPKDSVNDSLKLGAVDSENDEIICPNCGKSLKESNTFCIHCGTLISSEESEEGFDEDISITSVDSEDVLEVSGDDVGGSDADSEENEEDKSDLEDKLVCPSCGEDIKENNLFCIHCGASLSKDDKSDDEKIIEVDLKDKEEKEDKLVCPSCGKSVKEGNLFCIHCGASLSKEEPVEKVKKEVKVEENTIVCPSCGKSVKEGNLFCIHCGASLSKEEEPKKETTIKKDKKSSGINIFDYFEDKNENERLNKTEFIECLSCGSKIKGDNKFCPECGIDLLNIISCPNCGKANDKNDKFCTNCGSFLNNLNKDFIICKNCGEKLNSSNKFCTNCGERI